MGQIAGSMVEWATHTSNTVKGRCFGACPYCYMKALRKRFPRLDHPPEFDDEEVKWKPPAGALVFVGSALDLFHPAIPRYWIERTVAWTWSHEQAWFALLTKYPKHYADFEFPPNVLLGTTWDGRPETRDNVSDLISVVPRDQIAYVSFEPLLRSAIHVTLGANRGCLKPQPFVEWIIIGRDTNPGAKKPPDTWADQLMADADHFGIPVFLKDNYDHATETRKERPVKVTYKNRRR